MEYGLQMSTESKVRKQDTGLRKILFRSEENLQTYKMRVREVLSYLVSVPGFYEYENGQIGLEYKRRET